MAKAIGRRAHGDEPEVARPDVGERARDQSASDASTLGPRFDLGMHEHDRAGLSRVSDHPEQIVAGGIS